MSTPESGSPNLLDAFFPTAPADAEEEVEVDEVEGEGEDEGVVVAKARRSMPPPPPSMRGKRASAPPPRGRSPSQPGGLLPPVSVRATWAGLGPELERESEPPVLMDAPAHADESGARPRTEAAEPAKLEPETMPGGFGTDGDLDEGALFAEAEALFDAQAPGTPSEALEETPNAGTDMATALAASLALRGDAASDPAAMASESASGAAGSTDDEKGLFAELPRPPMPFEQPSTGQSSAWPTPSKIDEWDDDWAPSLSALGAREPERGSAPKADAAPPPVADPGRAPFRLSLPPPPPPPPRRSSAAAAMAPGAPPERIDEPEVAVEEESPLDVFEESALEPANETHREPMQSIEVSPFEASDELSREDLTRPLPPTELARLAAAEESLSERSEADLVRDDVTIPLIDMDGAGSMPSLSTLPDPYTSDTDLTRPLIALGDSGEGSRGLILPPLRPPPTGASEGNDVPLIVAVPPPTVGTVEHAPTIQITPGAGALEYTPTSQLQRPWGSPGSTSRGMRNVLPPIPKPAPVPSDFGKRGPSQSVAPVTGSVFPPAGPARRRWAIALAAVTFAVLVLGFGFRSRSGSLVVTVAGPGGEAVSGVSVRVDGTERCNVAPCIIKDLKAGMHLVAASANGLPASADRAVVLESGGQVAQHIALSAEERSTAGLSVAAIGTGLHVLVDGRDVGAPPVTLNDVAPGEHTVRILGAERYYQPYEEVVRLDRGEVRSLGPVRLRVLRGRLDLRAGEGSDGAAVAVDGRRVWHLPASIELSADESHEVSAIKPGHPELNQEVVFDGTAERTVNIAFTGDGSGAGSQAEYRPMNTAPRSTALATHATRSVAPPAPVQASQSSGTATLDLNSTPPAAVVVNGRPLGTTPIHGVHVGAGKQTVVFVHPSLGRKVASANVAPGGRASIGVKF